MIKNVHVELLAGRRVRDTSGRPVGRIQSIRARRRGSDYFVEEYHLGPAAFLEGLGISTAKLIGLPIARDPVKIPWDQLDLSDPEHPRLRCTKEELKGMNR